MGLYHRGADIAVSREFVDGPDVRGVLQQVGGKRMRPFALRCLADRMDHGGRPSCCNLPSR